ncbi:hypothetical protein ABPG77_001309 [Micractinium sp. CCAP 211/92]
MLEHYAVSGCRHCRLLSSAEGYGRRRGVSLLHLARRLRALLAAKDALEDVCKYARGLLNDALLPAPLLRHAKHSLRLSRHAREAIMMRCQAGHMLVSRWFAAAPMKQI